MNKNQKKIKLLISILVFIFFVSLSIYIYFKNYYIDLKHVDTNKIITNKDIDEPTVEPNNNLPNNYINKIPAYRNQYHNKYIVANLKVLNLDILVPRAKNNEYYLDHDIYNKYNFLGNPFIDFRNQDLLNNRQINIYGHNTEYTKYYKDLPFSNLEKYRNKDIYNNYKDVILNIEEKQLNYKIIAVKIINQYEDEHMNLVYNTNNDWLNHVNSLLSNTLYSDNVEISSNDHLLVLQACTYKPKNSYILIICKRE